MKVGVSRESERMGERTFLGAATPMTPGKTNSSESEPLVGSLGLRGLIGIIGAGLAGGDVPGGAGRGAVGDGGPWSDLFPVGES